MPGQPVAQPARRPAGSSLTPPPFRPRAVGTAVQVQPAPAAPPSTDLLTLAPLESFGLSEDGSVEGEIIDPNTGIPAGSRNGVSPDQETFNAEIARLRAMLRDTSGETHLDAGVMEMLRLALAATIDMMPVAREQYMRYKQERGAYAFSTLVNQARELSNDIRSLQDLDVQVQHIVTKIIQPAFTLIIQQMIQSLFNVRKALNNSTNDPKVHRAIKEELDNLLRTQGSFLQDMSGRVKSQLTEYLVERK